MDAVVEVYTSLQVFGPLLSVSSDIFFLNCN